MNWFHYPSAKIKGRFIFRRIFTIVFCFLPSIFTFAQEPSDVGIFNSTADWGSPESPPRHNQFKVNGRLEVSQSDDGIIYDIFRNGDKHLVGTALALDVDAFLLKPVQKNTLEKRLNQIIDEIEREESHIRPVECYTYIDVQAASEEISKHIEETTQKDDPIVTDTHISASHYSKPKKLKMPGIYPLLITHTNLD